VNQNFKLWVKLGCGLVRKVLDYSSLKCEW